MKFMSLIKILWSKKFILIMNKLERYFKLLIKYSIRKILMKKWIKRILFVYYSMKRFISKIILIMIKELLFILNKRELLLLWKWCWMNLKINLNISQNLKKIFLRQILNWKNRIQKKLFKKKKIKNLLIWIHSLVVLLN